MQPNASALATLTRLVYPTPHMPRNEPINKPIVEASHTIVLVLGLSNMRDAAAALVSDGRIVAAAEEERFVRQKHVTALPVHAIRYCLREAGVSLREVDALAVPWKYWLVGRRAWLAVTAMLRSPQLFRVKGERSMERVSREWMELFRLSRELTQRVGAVGQRPVFLDHHLCHAASSFLVSPFDRSAILVVDGASEADTTLMAMGEGVSNHRTGPHPAPALTRPVLCSHDGLSWISARSR